MYSVCMGRLKVHTPRCTTIQAGIQEISAVHDQPYSERIGGGQETPAVMGSILREAYILRSVCTMLITRSSDKESKAGMHLFCTAMIKRLLRCIS